MIMMYGAKPAPRMLTPFRRCEGFPPLTRREGG